MTYKCFLCKKEKIPEEEVFIKQVNMIISSPSFFHRTPSAVVGAGIRDCGPCLKNEESDLIAVEEK